MGCSNQVKKEFGYNLEDKIYFVGIIMQDGNEIPFLYAIFYLYLQSLHDREIGISRGTNFPLINLCFFSEEFFVFFIHLF